MTLASWLRRHPMLGYFALAYGISWGGILIILGTTGFELTALRPRLIWQSVTAAAIVVALPAVHSPDRRSPRMPRQSAKS